MVTSDKDGLDSGFERELPDPHRSRWRRPITLNAGAQPPAESSNQKVSELTGAVHRLVPKTRQPWTARHCCVARASAVRLAFDGKRYRVSLASRAVAIV